MLSKTALLSAVKAFPSCVVQFRSDASCLTTCGKSASATKGASNPALTAAAIRRRFSTATGPSPRTGLWVKAMTFLPVLAATQVFEEPTVDFCAGSGQVAGLGIAPQTPEGSAATLAQNSDQWPLARPRDRRSRPD